ncbi:MAG: patatin-like phospholipase family protein [Litorilinea sp.]
MIAVVLSGAGNRGPLQVGALRALMEEGIEPDFVVGTSAGAINAAFLGARGWNLTTLDAMAAVWASVTTQTIYPGSWLQKVWRVASNANSLYSSAGLAGMIAQGLPPNVVTFGEMPLPVFVTAVDLLSARLFVFGEDSATPIAPALLASASVPVIHPPVAMAGLQLVDGGVLANVAASFAMDRGAREIYVLNAGSAGGAGDTADSLWDVVGTTLSTLLSQAILRDLDRARAETTVDLHHIQLTGFRELSFRDFSQSAAMLDAGYEIAKTYLGNPAPQIVGPQTPPQHAIGDVVPGGREYYPPYPVR